MSRPTLLLIAMRVFIPGLGENVYVLQLVLKMAEGLLVTDLCCATYHL